MSSDRETDHNLAPEDSEDEFDWEEVEVPEHEPQHLEITINTKPKADSSTNKKKGISHAERLIRIDCHKIHTVALIGNAHLRNKWINDPLLHARLLSLTPLHLQTAFAAIHKSRVPDQNQRGRMFERAVEALVNWWCNTYFEVIPEGHIRNYTFDEIQQRLEIRGLHVPDVNNPDATLNIETLQDIIEDEVETVRSEKSLMKHALMSSGSRDTSAQLFTALCRALGIPARLVVSIQSVPWQAGVGKPKPKYERKSKGKEKEIVQNDDSLVAGPSQWEGMSNGRRLDGETPVPKSEKAKGKQKTIPVVKLRKQKSKGNVLGAPRKLARPDPLTTPPVFWTEVFSRADSKWFPVDPIRGIVNKRKSFDPTPSTPNMNPAPMSHLQSLSGQSITSNRRIPGTKVENRMLYVLAFEEDGYARDVTRRYAKDYASKVVKAQGGSGASSVGGGGKGRQAWWANVLRCIERPYQLHRDDLEDQELELLQLKEGMPSTIGGFKDHPLYVLTRHLRQTETIHPPPPATPELGKFRGEPVYPRSSVVSLKTSENWMRNMGRIVREGEQPMKMVKVRAGTVNRMRELEALKDDLKVAGDDNLSGSTSNSGPDVLQGLYAYSQTEPYVPEPVVNGTVPKNRFGNIDLYVPAMLPKGAAHLPYKGIAKIARKLGLDHAEAVTGFEFKKRRALPIIEGIVVAAENEAAILEAFWTAEREANEKARIKREDRALKLWTRLIHGLRIRQRLQARYGAGPTQHATSSGAVSENADANDAESGPQQAASVPHNAGGFLSEADKVVHAFHLPRNTHPVLPPPAGTSAEAHRAEEPEETDSVVDTPMPTFETYDLDTMDVDEATQVANTTLAPDHVPQTMAQMAEAAEAANLARGDGDEGGEIEIVITPESAPRCSAMRNGGGGKPTESIRSASRAPARWKSLGSRGTATRRKRTRRASSESLGEGGYEQEGEDSAHPSPTPNKRARKRVPAAPPSTRTLRPRAAKSKTAARLAEEREIEDALDEAVAE